MNRIQTEDIKKFALNFSLGKDLRDAKILVTGATGLIGSTFIHCLLSLNVEIEIIAPVRNIEKANTLFSKAEFAHIRLIECDIVSFNYETIGEINYIVHSAAPTASRFFVEYPVETFDTIYSGTKALLEYARRHPVKGFAYLSSLEVYGEIYDDSTCISEDIQGYLDVLAVRSCYPMAKRATENLCCLYAAEYGVPTKIARLTQTTGAGISKDDNRIIAQFARCAAYSEDIVLHTNGDSSRPYCYTTDTISAILYILLKGQVGTAYNVANEGTYISAKAMAEYVRDNFNPAIDVRIELNGHMGYAPTTKQNLSAEKLRALGWKPQYGLKDIFERLIAYLTE